MLEHRLCHVMPCTQYNIDCYCYYYYYYYLFYDIRFIARSSMTERTTSTSGLQPLLKPVDRFYTIRWITVIMNRSGLYMIRSVGARSRSGPVRTRLRAPCPRPSGFAIRSGVIADYNLPIMRPTLYAVVYFANGPSILKNDRYATPTDDAGGVFALSLVPHISAV